MPHAGLASRNFARDAPCSHHRDAVADRHHLAELVSDEQDSLAVCCHRLDGVEERLDLGRSEHGGRLVEEQDVGTPVEHLDDLDPLALPDREL